MGERPRTVYSAVVEVGDAPAPLPVPFAPLLLDAVSDSLKLNKTIRACFFMEEAQAVLQDGFWWVLATHFKSSDHQDVVQQLHDRAAANFTSLFMKLSRGNRDNFLQLYYHAMAETIWLALCFAFPLSQPMFHDGFKAEVLNTCAVWTLGLMPHRPDFSAWEVCGAKLLQDTRSFRSTKRMDGVVPTFAPTAADAVTAAREWRLRSASARLMLAKDPTVTVPIRDVEVREQVECTLGHTGLMAAFLNKGRQPAPVSRRPNPRRRRGRHSHPRPAAEASAPQRLPSPRGDSMRFAYPVPPTAAKPAADAPEPAWGWRSRAAVRAAASAATREASEPSEGSTPSPRRAFLRAPDTATSRRQRVLAKYASPFSKLNARVKLTQDSAKPIVPSGLPVPRARRHHKDNPFAAPGEDDMGAPLATWSPPSPRVTLPPARSSDSPQPPPPSSPPAFGMVDLSDIGRRIAMLKGVEDYTVGGDNTSRWAPLPSARTEASTASSPMASGRRQSAAPPTVITRRPSLDPDTGFRRAPDRTRRLATAAEVVSSAEDWQYTVVDVFKKNRVQAIQERAAAMKRSSETLSAIQGQRMQAMAPATVHKFANWLVSAQALNGV